MLLWSFIASLLFVTCLSDFLDQGSEPENEAQVGEIVVIACLFDLPENHWPDGFSQADYTSLNQLCTGDGPGSAAWEYSLGMYCNEDEEVTWGPVQGFQALFRATFLRYCMRHCHCVRIEPHAIAAGFGMDESISSGESSGSGLAYFYGDDCSGHSCYGAGQSCPSNCLCSAPQPSLLSPLLDLGASACVAIVMQRVDPKKLGGRSPKMLEGPETVEWLNGTDTNGNSTANSDTTVINSTHNHTTNAGRQHPNASTALSSDGQGRFYNLSTGGQVGCYCNTTYVSYACCNARPLHGIVHEPPANRLGPPTR